MKKFILFFSSIFCLLPISAQQTKLLTAEKHNEYGLVYTLPQTAFEVEVVAVKETKIAGSFSNYSKIFTSDGGVITENSVNWTIESVKVTPYGIPDSEKRYLMQLKAGATTFIEVADDNMLLSINKEVNEPKKELSSFNEIEGNPITGKEYLEFVNEDFIAAQSSYKQAQLLAEEIMEVREAKLSLTRGTADVMPTDGKQLEIMLSSLEKQEKALTNAFTGSSWKERISKSYTFIPKSESKTVLCRLSVTDGLVDASDYSGDPLYVWVEVKEEGKLPVDAKGEEKKLPKDAVIYCVPGVAELNMNFGGNTLFSKEYPMSQFGITFGLNPAIFTDKKEPSYAIFDSTTGGIKEIGIISSK